MSGIGKFKTKSKLASGASQGSVKKLQAALGKGLIGKMLNAPPLAHANSVVSKDMA